jgi:hypothetical protein
LKKTSTFLALIYTPDYIGARHLYVNRAYIMSYYRRVAKYNNIRFLDYSKSELCKQKDYFFDKTHLNEFGSTRFTKDLAKDIQN